MANHTENLAEMDQNKQKQTTMSKTMHAIITNLTTMNKNIAHKTTTMNQNITCKTTTMRKNKHVNAINRHRNSAQTLVMAADIA